MATAPRIEHSWQASEHDIARLCHYITDDGAVAAYFGTTRERVAKVRGGMAQRKAYLRTGQDVTSDTAINASTQKTEAEARDSSAMLLERCNKLFRGFARQHGITFEKAQELQLSGYRA